MGAVGVQGQGRAAAPEFALQDEPFLGAAPLLPSDMTEPFVDGGGGQQMEDKQAEKDPQRRLDPAIAKRDVTWFGIVPSLLFQSKCFQLGAGGLQPGLGDAEDSLFRVAPESIWYAAGGKHKAIQGDGLPSLGQTGLAGELNPPGRTEMLSMVGGDVAHG